MSASFRPMLGWNKPFRLEDVTYPCLASFKLDGWRAIWTGKEFISRTLKTIPNRPLQQMMEQYNIPPGWDGELIDGHPNSEGVFNRTDSIMKSHAKPCPGIRFFVFDDCSEPKRPYYERLERISDIQPRVVRVDQKVIESPEELGALYEFSLASGYEGLIVRSPLARYKFGRSTFNEQGMLKLKPLATAKAPIIGFKELLHNANAATVDERGYTKRSSHQDGKFASGMLGAVLVDWHGQVLSIGTGFTHQQRKDLGPNPDHLLGDFAEFSYLPYGEKELPRHPRILRIRSKMDAEPTEKGR